jgi:hypothetical protein
MQGLTRREALQSGAAALAGSVCPDGALTGAEKAKPLKPRPVCAVVTEYRTNSHADVIVGKILEGWKHDGGAGAQARVRMTSRASSAIRF